VDEPSKIEPEIERESDERWIRQVSKRVWMTIKRVHQHESALERESVFRKGVYKSDCLDSSPQRKRWLMSTEKLCQRGEQTIGAADDKPIKMWSVNIAG
jgi:hypothetical protein